MRHHLGQYSMTAQRTSDAPYPVTFGRQHAVLHRLIQDCGPRVGLLLRVSCLFHGITRFLDCLIDFFSGTLHRTLFFAPREDERSGQQQRHGPLAKHNGSSIRVHVHGSPFKDAVCSLEHGISWRKQSPDDRPCESPHLSARQTSLPALGQTCFDPANLARQSQSSATHAIARQGLSLRAPASNVIVLGTATTGVPLVHGTEAPHPGKSMLAPRHRRSPADGLRSAPGLRHCGRRRNLTPVSDRAYRLVHAQPVNSGHRMAAMGEPFRSVQLLWGADHE